MKDIRRNFPPGIHERLGYYVYRLIDPRNGETFYVGKGKGDRVFQHAIGALAPVRDEDAVDTKMQRIKDIRSAGLEIGHVIHRHAIKDAEAAFQVEAALIDAYPGLANRIGGHGGDFGVAHVEQIVTLYEAEPFVPKHSLLLISIGQTFHEEGRSVLDATRYAWKINAAKAQRAEFVVAHAQGMVKGVFIPRRWLPATKENFPTFPDTDPKRWGFEGEEAPAEIAIHYIGKRVPDEYRTKGAANPIRYIFPLPAAE